MDPAELKAAAVANIEAQAEAALMSVRAQADEQIRAIELACLRELRAIDRQSHAVERKAVHGSATCGSREEGAR